MEDKKINNNSYPVKPSKDLTEKDIDIIAEKKKKLQYPEYKKPKLTEAKFIKKKLETRVRPLLRYFNTKLIIPSARNQLIPGNVYVFNYSNYKHSPCPMIFYVGTNPRYSTLEGINLQYLSVSERKRLIRYFRKTPLHSDKAIKGALNIRSLMGDVMHIIRRMYSSDSIYNMLKNKLRKNKIYFYRRYKYSKISSRIYVAPIEALDRVLEINTPLKPINKIILEESKRKFANIINSIRKY